MLEWLGEAERALVLKAIKKRSPGKSEDHGAGGASTTMEMSQAVAARIR
jgi:hypothetical protein